MKLISKYSRTSVIASVIILLLASVAYYFVLHFILLQQIDDDLYIEKQELNDYVGTNQQLPSITASEDEITTYTLSDDAKKGKLLTKKLINAGETEPYRIIEFYSNVAGKIYKIEVCKSLENTEKIIRLVILITVITIIVLLLTTLVLNRIVLRRLWHPFYETLQAMKEYRLGKKNTVQFLPTEIEEFKLLNSSLAESINRNEEDYNTLKAFTENASHEMQTPVAVIRSQMDTLIQDSALTETQSNIVQEAYAALQKLSRLNRSLLLLTKIENRQFDIKENVDLRMLIEEKLVSFNEILHKKNITVVTEGNNEAKITMNAGLADVLVNNLLNNSIKYTSVNGSIEIKFLPRSVQFCNGPAQVSLLPNMIFTRFYKAGNHPDQHGLGLAIVKEICSSSGLNIEYFLKEERHVFEISF